MSFLKLVKERYSCRKLDGEKSIPKSVLSTILEAGRLAPTAANKQPQRIYIVETAANKEKIESLFNYRFDPYCYVLIGYDNEQGWKNDQYEQETGAIDCAIVATHLILSAQEQGVCSTWIGNFDGARTNAVFDLGSNFVAVAILALGYPKEGAKPSHRHEQRLDINEIVTYL